MNSNKPYLIRAIFEWIVDNGCTPFLIVNAQVPGARVPQELVEDGEIIFNISDRAVNDLYIKNDAVYFDARFSGVKKQIYVPIYAVLGICAQENEEGMFFDPQMPTQEELDEAGRGDSGSGAADSGPGFHVVD